MFENESRLGCNRRSGLRIILAALVLMTFSLPLVMASSSYETDGWSPCEHLNKNIPQVCPLYWLEKKVSDDNTPEIEFINYLPGRLDTVEFQFKKGIEIVVHETVKYGTTKIFELSPGYYEFEMLGNENIFEIRGGYNYKLIHSPKDDDGKPADPSTLPQPDMYEHILPTEYAYSDEPTPSPAKTSMPTEMPMSAIAGQTSGDNTTPNTSASRQDTTTPWIALVGGAILALAIVLIAGNFFSKRGRAPEKPVAPTAPKPAPPRPTPTKEGVTVKIKRGYEVLQNNDLRFGIHVINNTGYMIGDVETKLDYPKILFSLNGDVVQGLANISPNGERTAEYILTPLGCIHNEKIDATIFYKDHTGKKQTVHMQPKEVHCVCPFLKEKAMREGEFAELADACEPIEDGLSFSGIGINEIAAFVKEACVHRLYLIVEHEIDTTKVVYLAGESIGEKAYYLLTAVIRPYKDLTQVALRAYSDKPYGLHGFLNEIVNSIRHLVASVQSAKEIGIIESKQVINIIDSVVQRTSFGGTDAEGTVAGTTSVNIEDSVVQHTKIGSTMKCPSCGTEVQTDEKFCTACGAQLE